MFHVSCVSCVQLVEAGRDLQRTEYRQTGRQLASTDLPLEKHFYEAAGLGLVQLTALYDLDTSKVAGGDLLTFPSPHSLSSSDCVQLSSTARALGRLDMELDWLKEAVKLQKEAVKLQKETVKLQKEAVKLQRNRDKLSRLKVRLREVRNFHDQILLERGYFIPRAEYKEELASVEEGMEVVTKTRPDQRRLRNDSRLATHLETMRLRDRHEDHMNTNRPELHFNDGQINSVQYNLLHRESNNMSRLCAGAQTRHPAQDQELRCRLMTRGGHSYLRLGPFLLEELNTKPYIGLVHRFLGEEEAVQVMERAGARLIPTPYTVRGVWTTFSRGRASKIRYLPDTAGDVTGDLTRRMATLSPWKLLQPFAQENYQVMNYGPGGLISLHMDDATVGYQEEDFDSFQSGMFWRLGSTRLATAMLYLKSPVSGGRTVFPFLSLSVPPSPLGLLFWHNLSPDLTADTRAVHGACPVVVGDKWIMNKWVTLAPHWDTHSCPTVRDKQAAFPRWRS